jgi:uncharacterized protein YgiM (DUF1202 family)
MNEWQPRRAALVLSVFTIVLLSLAGCGPAGEQSLAEAYVAPATLNLRRELTDKNSAAIMLKHGDHLRIIDVKRRYVKARTDRGEEGWIDSAQLLSPEQMEAFRQATKAAQAMPSQGAATVYDALNVHIDPNRLSPSFMKIPEGDSVVTLAHKAVPKAAGQAPANSLKVAKPVPPPRRAKKDKAQNALQLKPPKPATPKVPDNWKELSAERLPGEGVVEKAQPAAKATEPVKSAKKQDSPVNILEDWTLVRTKDRQSGWVLTKNLNLSIPDDVAQYAEGKRIAAYFDLGAVNDEEKGLKHNWLWAISLNPESHDFDALRIFIWSRRHHRYETGWRERDIEGYFPIEVKPGDGVSPNRQFSAIVRDDDGKYWLQHLEFDGTRARLTGKEAYTPASQDGLTRAAPLPVEQMESKTPQPGWFSRQWTAVKRAFGR